MRDLSEIPKVVILGAGEGTRLRPHTNDYPKCMVEVDGRSLLDRQLDVLRAEGVQQIVLVGGHRAEKLEAFDVALRINTRYAETNMVWSLLCAEDDLTGECIVAYGDIVYSRSILQAVIESSANISVAIDLDWENYWRCRNEDPILDAETLKLAPDGRILEIGQRPKTLSEIEGQFMGIIKFSGTAIKTLLQTFHSARSGGELRGKSVEKAYMTDLLQALIDDGHRVQSVPVNGGWVEIDTVDDLLLETTRQRLAAIDEEIDH